MTDERKEEETPAEKTVTIDDVCDRWGTHRSKGPWLQEFMGQTGPWTEAEYQELDRRMDSLAEEDLFPGYTKKTTEGGPHGPDCECGNLSTEELELVGILAPALQEALGVGRTPAEKRTGTSDPEAAILDLLGGLQPLVDRVIKDGSTVGVATTMATADPIRATAALAEASKTLRKNYQDIGDVVALISTLLPACKGEQARSAEGLPIWFQAATPTSGWLTTAQAESPGDGWQAVYVR